MIASLVVSPNLEIYTILKTAISGLEMHKIFRPPKEQTDGKIMCKLTPITICTRIDVRDSWNTPYTPSKTMGMPSR